MSRFSYVLVAVGAAAVAATAATGLALASSSSPPTVKACTTATGFLKLANASGNCPSGTTAVTINERGPRGLPGLSPVSNYIDRTTPGGSDSATLPNGDTLSSFCGSNNGVPTPFVEISNTGASYYVHGTVDVQGGTVDYIDSTGQTAYPVGHTLIGESAAGYFQFAALGNASTPAYASIHVLVNNASDVFTVDVSVYSAPSRCQIIVEATPAS